MNINKFLLSSLVSVSLLSVSCAKNEEPVHAVEYELTFIASDDDYEVFDYDDSGRISHWEYSDASHTMSYNATYNYAEAPRTILINSEEIRSEDDTRRFEETLHLDSDGTAAYAEGIAVLNMNGSVMKKKYRKDFQYDSSRHLILVKISEKRFNDTGWEEQQPLEWYASLDWEADNLAKYTEYSNPSYPFLIKTYSYYGGVTVSSMPLIQGPVVHSFYLPLQYQGVLGRLSESLVKDCNYQDMTFSYSYNISATASHSFIESYVESALGKESAYTVGWQPKSCSSESLITE